MCIKKIEFYGPFYTTADYRDNKLLISCQVEDSGYYTEKRFPGDDDRWVTVEKYETREFILPEGFKKTGAFESVYSITYKEINGVNHLIKIDAGYEDDLNESLQNG